MDAANCTAVLLSVPISYYFHGCTALLVALVVVSGAILKIHTFYLYHLYLIDCECRGRSHSESAVAPGSPAVFGVADVTGLQRWRNETTAVASTTLPADWQAALRARHLVTGHRRRLTDDK